MSPYPLDPVDATGPVRLVLVAAPRAEATSLVEGALERRLAACANMAEVTSRYWWQGRRESAEESLIVFKTVPKRVGALFRYLAEHHTYDVPEILEVDVARVHPPYLEYLAATLDADAPPPPLGGGRRRTTRPGGRRGRGARDPARTRAPRRRP